MTKHKNSNEVVGNFCIYQILFADTIYKVGKADFDRITASTNMPTRIHQQIRILRKTYKRKRITHEITEILFGVSTLDAERMEKKVLRLVYEQTNQIPEGSKKSFKP